MEAVELKRRQRCEKCKYWAEFGEPSSEGWGSCLHAKVFFSTDVYAHQRVGKDCFVSVFYDGCAGANKVGRDFCCVHFERAEI